MSFQNLTLDRNPTAVLRPMPEWGRCFVYTPENPELFELNATAWLALELCDGRPCDEVETEYVEALAGKFSSEEARRGFREAIESLRNLGVLIERRSDQAISGGQ